MSVYSGFKVKSGYYTVSNKNKLRNPNKKLFYRSGLELKFMKICDNSKNIIEWGYEDVHLKYVLPYENGYIHTYTMDFYIKKVIDGLTKEYLIEVKPSTMLTPPPVQKRATKKYLELIKNYSVNKFKWESAIRYCRENKLEFTILTEKQLT